MYRVRVKVRKGSRCFGSGSLSYYVEVGPFFGAPLLHNKPRTETLGYDWEEVVRRYAPVFVSGLKSTRRLCRLYDWEEVVRRFAPVYVSGLKSTRRCGQKENLVSLWGV